MYEALEGTYGACAGDVDLCSSALGTVRGPNRDSKRDSRHGVELSARRDAGERDALREANEVLANNISSLFATAKAEIERKDRAIARLSAAA